MIKSTSNGKWWAVPTGLVIGLCIAALFRGHLNTEYLFIIACLCSAAVALGIVAVRHTSEQQNEEQRTYTEQLHRRHEAKRQRRAIYPSGPQAQVSSVHAPKA